MGFKNRFLSTKTVNSGKDFVPPGALFEAVAVVPGQVLRVHAFAAPEQSDTGGGASLLAGVHALASPEQPGTEGGVSLLAFVHALASPEQ
mgnify:CR=1 FL=1